DWAAKGQAIKDALLKMVDEDTDAFNKIIDAFRLPNTTEEEKTVRKSAVQVATKNAIVVPFKVMELSLQSFETIKAMVEIGSPNSVTDAGVGALCARAAIRGAFLNVKVNSADLEDKDFVEKTLREGQAIVDQAEALENEILEIVDNSIKA
ncbi:MAG: glutamate formiminotransferase/formiminotetrahydrofolate cyclodeaminase, partial [Saprospiraceae bacterium]